MNRAGYLTAPVRHPDPNARAALPVVRTSPIWSKETNRVRDDGRPGNRSPPAHGASGAREPPLSRKPPHLRGLCHELWFSGGIFSELLDLADVHLDSRTHGGRERSPPYEPTLCRSRPGPLQFASNRGQVIG